MNNNLENLLKELLKNSKLKKQATDINYLNGLLSAAHHNFSAAKYNFNGEFMDTSFKSTYDGILQISRVILLLNGYRPDDGEQHKTTFLIAGAFLGKEFEESIAKIDRYRIKRNNAIYQPIDFISKSEASGILESARDFWFIAKKYLKENNKQLELFNF